MPVSISWDDEAKTIIRWDYVGKWTWAEVERASEEALALMNSAAYPICLIHDFSHSAGLPACDTTTPPSVSSPAQRRRKPAP